MPRPSAQTKCFLSKAILKLSRTKILSGIKKYVFFISKAIQMNISGEKVKEELDYAKLYPIVNNLDFQINKNLNHLSYRIRNMK